MSGPFADRALIDEIRAGSPVAFDLLMKRHERTVFRVAWSYTGDRDDALDVCQEVFVKVFRRIDSYRGEGSFLGWLLRIAHREGIDWVRKGRILGRPDGRAAIEPQAAGPSQEEDLIRRERTAWLMSELNRLNHKQRTALSLRYFESSSIGEISAVLGCSEGTTRNILFRGLKKLRDRWAGYGENKHEHVSPLSGTNPGPRGR